MILNLTRLTDNHLTLLIVVATHNQLFTLTCLFASVCKLLHFDSNSRFFAHSCTVSGDTSERRSLRVVLGTRALRIFS